MDIAGEGLHKSSHCQCVALLQLPFFNLEYGGTMNQNETRQTLDDWHKAREADRPRVWEIFLVPAPVWLLGCWVEGLAMGTLAALPIALLFIVIYSYKYGRWQEKWDNPHKK